MAVPSTAYPAGGVTRDWTTEITPGFAYGGASGGTDRAYGSWGGGTAGGGSTAEGGAPVPAPNSAGERWNTAGGAYPGTQNSGNQTGGTQTGWDQAGGTQNSGNQTGGTQTVWNQTVGTQGGGTQPNSTSVRAGWYPGGGYMDIIGKDIENNMPPSEIGAPDSLEEVFRGSMKALLLRNIGNYVVATFLIGTQGTVSWEGILYDVGNDYLAIYQTGRDQYIVSDLYSLKYVEFYDTRRREMCEAMLNGQAGG